ncbi:CHASE2 domain-containing protein [Flammeovirga yaeyamensis]|uniref:CHASE2 domain-containing protein n=1 Tax=Flammeovirga yaeyamensis TaxID=367791 RepID=A0AAX1N2S2_9BACT|nr:MULTISPECIES: CHASE2 domain-containing protein [Flammeovirga]ANQ50766.1 CHASE2 domain-containing protein [Flammeovirga sp. MY04]MBB3701521.1 CHASE2 domain-containing sensor protein [Flammeovirga yaeyamensis]NMF38665.1 CHASE2 domain-containing protein [Flammeovirga yaeyamensis]QWG01840.1 CHASE2 domain-containing protein [Flammeovirga yaeyamensis]
MTKIRLFNKEAFLGTVFIFIFLWLLQASNLQVEVVNVFEQVFENFELTDVYYTEAEANEGFKFEPNVVLVNIGNLDRAGIAKQILRINQYKPKVIGIDATFVGPRPKNPAGDFMLAQALNQVGKSFVMATMPDNWNVETNEFDTLKLPYAPFAAKTDHAHVYTGILTDEEFTTWRDFPVYVDINGEREYALAVKLAEKFAPEKTKKFLERGNEKETIFFKGNQKFYFKLDIEDFNDPEKSFELVKDKIVLMGYMGDGYRDKHWDADKFFTPLNKNSVGRGYPDMYGVVVHANIISMILDGNYVDEMSDSFSYILAFLVCYFNAIIFIWIVENRNLAIWYNAITKSIQLIEAIIVMFLTIYLYGQFKYIANFTLLFIVILLSGDLIEIFAEIILRVLYKAKDKLKK